MTDRGFRAEPETPIDRSARFGFRSKVCYTVTAGTPKR
jgi:hypothetical protein